MVKRITRKRWLTLQKRPSGFVKNAFIKNGKRFIYDLENSKIIEVEVIGMRPVTKKK